MSERPTDENFDPAPKTEKPRRRRNEAGIAIALLSFIGVLVLHFFFGAGDFLVLVVGVAAIAYILFAREG